MSYLTASAAQRARRENSSFAIRVEYTGWTDKGNRSSKFWMIQNSIGGRLVEVSWGKIGCKPRKQLKPWSDAYNKLYEKLNKGYRYASGTQDEYVASPKPAAPSKLTGPFSLIRALRSLGHEGWEALDSGGSVLFELPPASGRELRDTYNIRVTA